MDTWKKHLKKEGLTMVAEVAGKISVPTHAVWRWTTLEENAGGIEDSVEMLSGHFGCVEFWHIEGRGNA